MGKYSYADLLATRAWFDWMVKLNDSIQSQNDRMIAVANRIQSDNELLINQAKRALELADRLQAELDHERWLNGQDWEGFPVQ